MAPAMTLVSRSCPTCHSIGKPRLRVGGRWTDWELTGGTAGPHLDLCTDRWHDAGSAGGANLTAGAPYTHTVTGGGWPSVTIEDLGGRAAPIDPDNPQWPPSGGVVKVMFFPVDAKVDVVFADGRHRYWSTHCRHGQHDACAATELAPGVPRRPAQCKTCAAPCLCPCHADG